MKLLSLVTISALALSLAGCTSPTTSNEVPLELLLSGPYTFSMSVGTQYLSGSKCPTQSLSFATNGPASVAAGASADDTITVTIEDETLLFAPLDNNDYNTGPMSFPTLDGNNNPVTGTAYFEMTVVDSETANGVLKWDNAQGCKGNYPFTLEYVSS